MDTFLTWLGKATSYFVTLYQVDEVKPKRVENPFLYRCHSGMGISYIILLLKQCLKEMDIMKFAKADAMFIEVKVKWNQIINQVDSVPECQIFANFEASKKLKADNGSNPVQKKALTTTRGAMSSRQPQRAPCQWWTSPIPPSTHVLDSTAMAWLVPAARIAR